MTLKINYAGLKRAENRDRKFRKRKKLDMVVDGKSAQLLFQESLKVKGKKKKHGHLQSVD